MPEAAMAVRRKLVLLRQALERLVLPGRVVAFDVVADLWRQHEEAAVDPAALARLLLEAADPVATEVDRAPAPARLNRRHRGEGALPAVEGQQLAQVDVGHSVAVGEEELLVAHVRQHALEPSAGLRLVARVDQGDAPRL